MMAELFRLFGFWKHTPDFVGKTIIEWCACVRLLCYWGGPSLSVWWPTLTQEKGSRDFLWPQVIRSPGDAMSLTAENSFCPTTWKRLLFYLLLNKNGSYSKSATVHEQKEHISRDGTGQVTLQAMGRDRPKTQSAQTIQAHIQMQNCINVSVMFLKYAPVTNSIQYFICFM